MTLNMTPRMTCQALRSALESDPQAAAVSPGNDGEIAEHLKSCSSCRQFVAERQELGKGLRLVRDSASPVPESLDAAVLASYRRHVAERGSTTLAMVRRPYPAATWRWAPVAAIVLIAGALFIFARKPIATGAAHNVPQPKAAQPVASVQPVQAAASNKPIAQPVSGVRPSPAAATRKHSARTTEPASSKPMQAAGSLPDGFRSLMYCDQLSCMEAMDVIRIQLPATGLARPAGWLQTGGAVNADVLVGPDGVARGIRIEE